MQWRGSRVLMRSLRAMRFAALMLTVLAHALSAQSLTLTEALARADAGAYGNRVARARAATQAGEALKPWQGILPQVRLEAGYMRTTDPVGAFGTTLRQRTITQADFDPAKLNHPAVAPNYSAAVVLEQPLVNLDAHLGRRAASLASAAAQHAAAWAEFGTALSVVRAYYGAVLVQERVHALAAALSAAEAHVRQAESMVKQGVATKSDALLARVRAGEVRVQLLEARGDASLSRRRLALLFGAPADTSFELPAQLPTTAVIQSLNDLSWVAAPSTRGDVQAAQAGAAAARADAQRARASWLPRLNAVARYDWHSAAGPYRGDSNWSVGVMATWSPFASASQIADVRVASARVATAQAEAAAARAQAELHAASAANAWDVALERVSIAASAVTQSEEAHRIVARKYEGGLATMAELLGAAAADTEARLRDAHARYEAIVAAAERLQSTGRTVAELARMVSDQ